MYCINCGIFFSENEKFCTACGTQQNLSQTVWPDEKPSLRGFSKRINNPAFAKYVKNTNRWSAIFSMILAVAAVIGFFIYGETSPEMENPQALFIGLGIGGMFLLIALFQIIGRKRSTTWDGTVADKAIKKKTERHNYGDNDYHYVDYLEYTVIIRSDQGKKYHIRSKDDDTQYNYYCTGDRIRHHAGLNSFEKFDKTGDSFVLCGACATLCDIKADVCFRCGCPLLK